MRYQNWDVLLFPEISKVPLQEFKTSCHVIHDQETFYRRNAPSPLPTVTSFVPSLPAGAPFRVSVHSWHDPEPSAYSKSRTKLVDDIMFEARVFIDGRLAGARVFAGDGPWPTIVETSLEMNENGEIQCLIFPVFHHELLSQSYWNAGDELGRVKVVIAEGCARDSSKTLGRTKNIVAFSFQHAPLEILETSAIAWPNALMWRQAQLSVSYPPLGVSPPSVVAGDIEDHSHSPRPRAPSLRPPLPPPTLASMLPPDIPPFPRTSDPFIEPAGHWRRPSTTDVSMPDYSSSVSRSSQSRRVTDPMMIDRQERRFETMQSAGAYESICEKLLPAAPDNTPQDTVADRSCDTPINREIVTQEEADYYPIKYEANIPSPLPTRNSNLHIIKSRKENRQQSTNMGEKPGSLDATRKLSQTLMSHVGGDTKRQRIVTPAAFKVIDEEDEPKSSPTRKNFQATAVQEGERRVLSGIEVNIL